MAKYPSYTLTRTRFTNHGIFGKLDLRKFTLQTLERHFPELPGGSKVPVGEYLCMQGDHRLKGMKHPFETYEIMSVPNRSGILFHMGNYETDSEGCVLLGMEAGESMLYKSKQAFEAFMELLEDYKFITLHIEEKRYGT